MIWFPKNPISYGKLRFGKMKVVYSDIVELMLRKWCVRIMIVNMSNAIVSDCQRGENGGDNSQQREGWAVGGLYV